ncbi:MAG: hypothetical protein IPI19_19620 [Ignavibacteriales bacterium]|nr:hypothetical protein [Ignavibacteriales bacterium]
MVVFEITSSCPPLVGAVVELSEQAVNKIVPDRNSENKMCFLTYLTPLFVEL